jgi:hypothetical protein
MVGSAMKPDGYLKHPAGVFQVAGEDEMQRRKMSNFTSMLPRIVTDFFLNNQTDAQIIQIYSVIKLYMFRASSVPIVRSFPLYIRHW